MKKIERMRYPHVPEGQPVESATEYILALRSKLNELIDKLNKALYVEDTRNGN